MAEGGWHGWVRASRTKLRKRKMPIKKMGLSLPRNRKPKNLFFEKKALVAFFPFPISAFFEIYKISLPSHLLNPKRKTMKSHSFKVATRTRNTSRKIEGNKRCAQLRGAAEKARENGKRPELNYMSRRYITRSGVEEPEAH